MYIIISYDISEDKCSKVMKVLKKYLFHIQNSVFEGELTDKELKALKEELIKIHLGENDSVIFFKLSSMKVLRKDYLGLKRDTNIII